MKKAIFLIVMLCIVFVMLPGCSNDEKSKELAKNSGVLSAIAEEDEEGLYKINWDVEVVQDASMHSSPIRYLITFNFCAGSVNHELGMVEVEGIKLTDERAFKTGTVAFIVKGKSSPKIYRKDNGESVRGEKETANVYVYDIETDTFFGQKRFAGDSLDDTYENYRGGDIFINKINYSEIRSYLDELCDE